MGKAPRRTGRPTKVDQIELAERRAQALKLRKAGVMYEQIAERLGYSDGPHAARDITRGIRETPRDDAKELVQLELLRLDQLLQSMWPEALKGSTWHVDRCLAIADRRARYLGLDAPAKLEVTAVTALDEKVRALEAELQLHDTPPADPVLDAP